MFQVKSGIKILWKSRIVECGLGPRENNCFLEISKGEAPKNFYAKSERLTVSLQSHLGLVKEG